MCTSVKNLEFCDNEVSKPNRKGRQLIVRIPPISRDVAALAMTKNDVTKTLIPMTERGALTQFNYFR